MSLNVDYVGTHGYDGLIQNGNLNAANMAGSPHLALTHTRRLDNCLRAR